MVLAACCCRESGTEPVIRLMAEAEDEALLVRVVDALCQTITDIVQSA